MMAMTTPYFSAGSEPIKDLGEFNNQPFYFFGQVIPQVPHLRYELYGEHALTLEELCLVMLHKDVDTKDKIMEWFEGGADVAV